MAIAGFAYFFSLPEPLWASIGWNILFGLVNLWRIWLAILERRPPRLSDEEQRLHQVAFSDLALRDYRKLLDVGQWENGMPPAVLVGHGTMAERVWMVAEGLIEVRRENGCARQIAPGDFVGETCFLSGRPMPASVVIVEPVRFMSWPVDGLRSFMDADPGIASQLQRILGRGLVRKLQAA